MADVTVSLIFYRMKESYSGLSDRYGRLLDWYTDFSWRRVDVLDMLFLGWLLGAFLVVGAINVYLRFFGLPRSKKGLKGNDKVGSILQSKGETVQWVNSALSWLYLYHGSTPRIVDAWIQALNEEARKHAVERGLQVKFDRVQTGSLPPRVSCVRTDPASKDTLDLYAAVEATDTTLVISAVQSTATKLKVTGCEANISRLSGQVHVHGWQAHDGVALTLTFATPPELAVKVTTRNYDSSVDTAEVTRIVRAALESVTVVTNISSSTAVAYGNHLSNYGNSVGTMDTITPQHASPVSSSLPASDTRLLVKVIKANGLGDKDFGCTDPYCTVQLDVPPQTHTTSVVRNTVNPFWDEHFLFDYDGTSKQIKFEVYDREKPTGDDFLGRALINVDEIRRLPSSRQIVPLTGCEKATTTTSGSVTVEFTFVDPSEAASLNISPSATSGVSPRRRIETNTRVAPGGTQVTTTTTTTEKARDHRVDPFYNESLNRIERPEGTYSADYSPYNSAKGASSLEAHDAALSASPVSTLSRGSSAAAYASPGGPQTSGGPYSGPQTSGGPYGGPQSTSPYGGPQSGPGGPPGGPRLTLTRPALMSESSPRDERGRDTLSLSTTSSHDNRDKKKSTLKKLFSRPKKRSQSADRAYSSSFKETSLLRPPVASDGPHSKTAEDVDPRLPLTDSSLRASRSHSFSSSLKRIFKKKKKDGGPASRESSLSRGGGPAGSREGSVSHPSPHLSSRQLEADGDLDYNQYSYSASMPHPSSPLGGGYNH